MAFAMIFGTAVLMPAPSTWAASAISYQGVLRTGAGASVAGVKQIYFRIYDTPSGGTTPLWSESQFVQLDTNGLFNIQLGTGTLPQGETPVVTNDIAGVFAKEASDLALTERYLELTVVDGTTPSVISPRQQFLAAPYALGVANVEEATGDFQVGGTLTAMKALDVQGMLSVGNITGTANGGATINGNLMVTGTFTTGSDSTINGNLYVNGLNGITANNLTMSQGTLTSYAVKVTGGALTVGSGIFARGGVPGQNASNNNGYAFTGSGDNDSGLYSTQDGRVSLYANAGEMLRVDAGDQAGNTPGFFLFNLGQGSHDATLKYNKDTGEVTYDSSSRRNKENIRPLEDDFTRVLQAEPRTYTRPGRPNRWEIGYVAEELDEIGLKRLVQYDSSGQPSGVAYDRVCLYLARVARDQAVQLREQREIITALEQRLSRLERTLSSDEIRQGAIKSAAAE
jgi:hypothetical protein